MWISTIDCLPTFQVIFWIFGNFQLKNQKPKKKNSTAKRFSREIKLTESVHTLIYRNISVLFVFYDTIWKLSNKNVRNQAIMPSETHTKFDQITATDLSAILFKGIFLFHFFFFGICFAEMKLKLTQILFIWNKVLICRICIQNEYATDCHPINIQNDISFKNQKLLSLKFFSLFYEYLL